VRNNSVVVTLQPQGAKQHTKGSKHAIYGLAIVLRKSPMQAVLLPADPFAPARVHFATPALSLADVGDGRSHQQVEGFYPIQGLLGQCGAGDDKNKTAGAAGAGSGAGEYEPPLPKPGHGPPPPPIDNTEAALTRADVWALQALLHDPADVPLQCRASRMQGGGGSCFSFCHWSGELGSCDRLANARVAPIMLDQQAPPSTRQSGCPCKKRHALWDRLLPGSSRRASASASAGSGCAGGCANAWATADSISLQLCNGTELTALGGYVLSAPLGYKYLSVAGTLRVRWSAPLPRGSSLQWAVMDGGVNGTSKPALLQGEERIDYDSRGEVLEVEVPPRCQKTAQLALWLRLLAPNQRPAFNVPPASVEVSDLSLLWRFSKWPCPGEEGEEGEEADDEGEVDDEIYAPPPLELSPEERARLARENAAARARNEAQRADDRARAAAEQRNSRERAQRLAKVEAQAAANEAHEAAVREEAARRHAEQELVVSRRAEAKANFERAEAEREALDEAAAKASSNNPKITFSDSKFSDAKGLQAGEAAAYQEEEATLRLQQLQQAARQGTPVVVPAPSPLPATGIDPYQAVDTRGYLAGFPAGEGYRGEPLSSTVGGGFFDPKLKMRHEAR